MNRFLISLTLFFLSFFVFSQTQTDTIPSKVLDSSRVIKIQLPRNYNSDEAKKYPLLVVLDADYLFEPVAGNVDYQSYWEDIPDCIIVGVNQEGFRDKDLIKDSRFSKFITNELIPLIDSRYNTSKFRIGIGHSKSARFLNYFAMQSNSNFRAFVSISPTENKEEHLLISEKFKLLNKDVFYILSTASEDLDNHKSNSLALNTVLEKIESSTLTYKFYNFNDATHYSVVGRTIPKALTEIFSLYKPISRDEYKNEILTSEESPYDYLINKYNTIESFYGFKKNVVENDVRAIAAACKKKDDMDSYLKLTELINTEFKGYMLSAYYRGLYYELQGNYKKALLSFKSGLSLKPSQSVNKDMMLDKMYALQNALKR